MFSRLLMDIFLLYNFTLRFLVEHMILLKLGEKNLEINNILLIIKKKKKNYKYVLNILKNIFFYHLNNYCIIFTNYIFIEYLFDGSIHEL